MGTPTVRLYSTSTVVRIPCAPADRCARRYFLGLLAAVRVANGAVRTRAYQGGWAQRRAGKVADFFFGVFCVFIGRGQPLVSPGCAVAGPLPAATPETVSRTSTCGHRRSYRSRRSITPRHAVAKHFQEDEPAASGGACRLKGNTYQRAGGRSRRGEKATCGGKI